MDLKPFFGVAGTLVAFIFVDEDYFSRGLTLRTSLIGS
jgi:hypothetical protein